MKGIGDARPMQVACKCPGSVALHLMLRRAVCDIFCGEFEAPKLSPLILLPNIGNHCVVSSACKLIMQPSRGQMVYSLAKRSWKRNGLTGVTVQDAGSRRRLRYREVTGEAVASVECVELLCRQKPQSDFAKKVLTRFRPAPLAQTVNCWSLQHCYNQSVSFRRKGCSSGVSFFSKPTAATF